ncbi:MAG: cyclase family protein [Oligoflexia bacterium]|nr:cyclase family protein [Oligoflexia bacterium]
MKKTEMKIIDLTLELDSLNVPVWPGELPLNKDVIKSLDRGDNVNLSSISLGAHLGTHIDSPSHFLKNQSRVGDINLSKLVGNCVVIEIMVDNNADLSIGVDKLEKYRFLFEKFSKVLFKTNNSVNGSLKKPFSSEYISLAESGALFLAQFNLDLIGWDYISIEATGASKRGAPVHKALLAKNIIILEGIDLSQAEISADANKLKFKEYNLYCLPLKINDIEAVPVRAILVER